MSKQPGSSNVTLRLDDELIQRIDQTALRQGLSRTQYIISWLPEAYEHGSQRTAGRRNGTSLAPAEPAGLA